MKAFIKIIAILLLGVIGCSKAPLPTETTDKPDIIEPSKLYITAMQEDSEPINEAKIYLNGNYIGVTPLEHQFEQEGICAIRIQKEHFLVHSQSVEIMLAKSVYVEAVLHRIPENKGQLLITVDQDSSEIQVNDLGGVMIHQRLGKETAVVLTSSGYFINILKKGFQPLTRATKVIEDSVTIENLQLIPLSIAQSPQISIEVPDSVMVNHPVLVKWQSENATRVDIDYIDNPGLNGKREIIFTTAGKRIINATAYNNSTSTSAADTVVVYSPAPVNPVLPTLTFSVTPKVVNAGEPVNVQWQTDGTQVIIDQGIGIRGREGNDEKIFSTPGMKIFTAIAYSKEGLTRTAKDSVYVKRVVGQLPEITLQVIDSALVNDPIQLIWQSINAQRVDIDYLGSVGLNGKSEIHFDTPGKRIITATAYNANGQKSVQDTVIIYLKTDPIHVACGYKIGAFHPTIKPIEKNAAKIAINQPGRYKVVANVEYDSGDEQKNESFYLAIRNNDETVKWPFDPNVGQFKVVADDPGPAHTANREAGIFYFSSGMNTFELYHYVTISQQYPQFVVGSSITGAESLRILSFEIQYLGK
ncbi:PEGA domain-containing protein [candidate division KSB1 bacterium]|nr:PEGA domain-containing protein [candidate division KSB1 bacterium]